jgi:hypothetical protein
MNFFLLKLYNIPINIVIIFRMIEQHLINTNDFFESPCGYLTFFHL